jgi:hypothetical protein
MYGLGGTSIGADGVPDSDGGELSKCGRTIFQKRMLVLAPGRCGAGAGIGIRFMKES